ncbi:MAG: TraB/GumN family protein, partial [Myxococcota bacterium]|nr:TraB/GumN family protein [Myxococcota bacterium]
HFPEGQSLSQLMGKEPYERLLALLKDKDITVADLDRSRPWLVSLALVVGAAAVDGPPETGGDEEAPTRRLQMGHDRFFVALADTRRVVSLETLESQFSVLSSPEDAHQVKRLLETMDTLEQGVSPVTKVLEHYASGELAQDMAELKDTTDDSAQGSEYYDRLLPRRNRTMADSLQKLLEAGERPFVVVGALHTLGAESLPRLMLERGYTVRPIAPSGDARPITLPEDHASALPTERISGWVINWPVEAKEKEVDYKGQKLLMKVATLPGGVGAMVFNRMKQPAIGIFNLERFYEHIANQTAVELGGEILDTTHTTVSGDVDGAIRLKAMRCHVSGPKGHFKSVMIWADGTLYQLMIIIMPTKVNDENLARADTLLDSFGL